MNRIITQVLESFQRKRESLIPILQQVQGVLGYLPEEAIKEIAQFLALSKSDIYGVAGFYSQFRFSRQGEHTVKVCQGTACHVRGGKQIMVETTGQLHIQPGETSPDYKFSLERVACFGACALGPVMVVDNVVHGRMTPAKTKQALSGLQ
jgi:NADH:ubiquinone oxidoreductase subunit E